ncbi:cysteine hydrolase [Actinoplanes sp. NBC_00393]|uniref:cysteine hydrolase family protein n=1 Tax=Actinoplanes sp. NBC_00393 TaxID=2975953 RepID=UPI002E2130C8
MTNALVVIDVQESFRARPLWSSVNNPDVVKNVGLLVEAARAAGDPVIWVVHAEPGTGGVFDPESGFVRVVDELTPADGEPVLVKTVHNAFTTTDLQHRLTVAGIRSLTICGLRTEQCVETTTRVASDLGYEVTFVTDATATFPIPHWNGGSTLSAEDVVARTEYALAGRFATIRTVAEIVGG